jgi:hypothetical protein
MFGSWPAVRTLRAELWPVPDMTKGTESWIRPPSTPDARGSRTPLTVHRTFSNLKTWLKGTHHGVSAKHLPHYVNEFVFRFNRRRMPMAAFRSLLGLTTQHAPTTHKMLYAAEPTG